MVKLFAIKQPYSNKIFNKEKFVEFRRQNVHINKNEACLVYTSSPIKKITGYFIVKEKIRMPLEKLWVITKKYAGITKKEFLSYFEGCKEGTALLFKYVKKLSKSLHLEEIRKKIKDFRPPQSYCNIDKEFFKKLNISDRKLIGYTPQFFND